MSKPPDETVLDAPEGLAAALVLLGVPNENRVPAAASLVSEFDAANMRASGLEAFDDASPPDAAVAEFEPPNIPQNGSLVFDVPNRPAARF